MSYKDHSKHTCEFDGRDACRTCASYHPPDGRYRIPIYDSSPAHRAKKRARAAIGRASNRVQRAAQVGSSEGTKSHDNDSNEDEANGGGS